MWYLWCFVVLFIAFLHDNFPQRECNSLRFKELGRRIPEAWEISAPLSVQRYKNEGKWQNKFLFIFTLPSAITLCKGRKKVILKRKISFLRYVNYVHYVPSLSIVFTPLSVSPFFGEQKRLGTYWSARNATKDCYENENSKNWPRIHTDGHEY